MFFPEQFSNPLSAAHWRQQKQKLINTLTGIIEEKSFDEENEKIDMTIARTMRVKNFQGGEEIKYDNDFEMNCIVLGKHSVRAVKDCTTKEYFSLIKYVNKQKDG